MSIEEVKKRMPRIARGLNSAQSRLGIVTVGERTSEFGAIERSVPKNDYGIERIRNVWLVFLDGRLIKIELVYSDALWTSREGFASEVARLLNLPAVGWQHESEPSTIGRYAFLTNHELLSCEGFTVAAALSDASSLTGNYYPMVRLNDVTASSEMAKRQKEDRETEHTERLKKVEKQRQTFRP